LTFRLKRRPMKFEFSFHPSTSTLEARSWKDPSKCAYLAPDGAVSALSGDLKYHAEKAKLTEWWGRKATGLIDSL